MLENAEPGGTLVGATLGNYHVTGQIGRGGMGAVYRAVHRRLGKTVAIKSLLREDAANPRGHKQLLAEARLASRVVSPYVATVFDVIEERDRCYIVMEEIEGRRLDKVLDDDRPGADELTRYATEIAEALAAIHGAGIVHRDLKPANVMITATGHVKVMDFGLAQGDPATWIREASSATTESTRSVEGTIAGTIAYMSPEQIRGEKLDARSDLFSFGTMLHEAVTGLHPFQRESILATASAILHEPPAAAPAPPDPGSSALLAIASRLLSKDKDERYASAEDLLADLSLMPAPKPQPKLHGSFRRWAGAAAAIVAIGIAAWMLWPPPPPPTTRPVVAILPFEDKTGEPKGDLRASLLADLLAAHLADSSRVRPLASDRIREIVAGAGPRAEPSRLIEAVAGAVPVRWLVTGSLFKEGESYYASISVVEPGGQNPHGPYRVSATGTAAMAERADAILRDNVFGTGGGETSALWRSSSDEAQLLEQEARTAIRELRYRDAIEKLEKALSLDPSFITARIRLAEALDGAGYGTRARQAADRAVRDIEALGEAASRSTLAFEARAIEARTHGDTDAEIEARRAVVEAHGDDPVAHRTLSNALTRRGKSSEALPEAQTAIALDPKDPASHVAEAAALNAGRKFDDAMASLKRADDGFVALKSAVGHAIVEQVSGEVSYRAARYAEAKQHYEVAADGFARENLEARSARARKGAGDALLQQGNLEAAAAIYESVLAIARKLGDFRTIVKLLENTGAQHFARGEFDKAERALRESRAEAIPLGNSSLLAGPTLNLASLLAYTGRHSESKALAEEALRLSRETQVIEQQTGALVLIGDALDAEGRLDEAVRAFREIVESDVLSKAPGAPVGDAYVRLADIYRDRGELAKALEASEKGIAFQETIEKKLGLGYAFLSRALSRADLGLYAEAAADIQQAEKLAADSNATAFAKARWAANQGRSDEAERALSGLRKASLTGKLAVRTPALSALVAVERGRYDEAVRQARLGLSRVAQFPREEAALRSLLSRALAGTHDADGAEAEARKALEAGERLGLPIAVARACAVLGQLTPPVPDRDALASKGRAALDRLLDGAPDDRRAALGKRSDLAFVFGHVY